MTEQEYEARAMPELKQLTRALDELEDPGLEIELAGDILTLEFQDGKRYVVNSHRAARQIWMAAELRAWHFDFLPETERWVAAKSGDELWSTLERVLATRLGRTVALTRA